MDYDACIAKIDGALMSLKKRGCLNNADNDKDVVDTIKEIIQYFTETEKRKAVFYMLLNTDISVLDRLLEDENIEPFIRTPAYLEKFYFMYYIYETGLQDHLNCAVKFCPSVITVELLKCIIKNYKVELYGYQQLCNLWEALFVKIWRVENDYDLDNTQELLVCFKELYYILQKVLVSSKNESSYGFSLNLYYCFNSIRYFVDLFTKKEFTLEKDDIYNITIDTSQNDVKSSCKECFEVIFSNLKDILCCLTVDTWMDLLEVDVESLSVQELVGNCIYSICEASNVIDIPNEMLACLSSLKIRPKTESDKIAEADIDEIIQMVNEGKRDWFEGLIRHDDCCTEKSLECILKNLSLASEKDIDLLLNTLIHNFKKTETGQRVFFAAFKLLPECKYKPWTDKIYDECHPIPLLNQNDLVETFNKFTREGDINLADLLCLFMQAPHEIIKQISTIAINNYEQVDFCVELLSTLAQNAEKFFNEKEHSLSEMILKLLSSDLNDRQQQSVIEFVMKLTKEKLLEGDLVLMLFQVVKESLPNDKLETVVLCLRVIKQILKKDLVDYNKPVVLVLLSQILGHLMWDLKTFSTVKVDGVDVVVEIADAIIKKLNKSIELEWTRQEILKSWEVTQAVFCDLWFHFGKKWVGSRKLHSCILALAYSNHPEFLLEILGVEDALNLRPTIIFSLFKVLPVISYQGWLKIFSSIASERIGIEEPQDVLDLFGSALYLLTLKLQNNSEIYCCYKYCLRNFGRLVSQTMSKLKSNGLLRTIERLGLVLYTIISLNEAEDCILILSPVIIDLKKQLGKTNESLEFQEKIKEMLRVIEENGKGNAVKFLEKLKC